MPQWLDILIALVYTILLIRLGEQLNQVNKIRVLYKTLNLDSLELMRRQLDGTTKDYVSEKWQEHLILVRYRVLNFLRARHQRETQVSGRLFLESAMQTLQQEGSQWCIYRVLIIDKPTFRKGHKWSKSVSERIYLEIEGSPDHLGVGQRHGTYVIDNVPEDLATLAEETDYLASFFRG